MQNTEMQNTAIVDEEPKMRLVSNVSIKVYAAIQNLRTIQMEKAGKFISRSDFIEENIFTPYIDAAKNEGLLP